MEAMSNFKKRNNAAHPSHEAGLKKLWREARAGFPQSHRLVAKPTATRNCQFLECNAEAL